MHTFKHSTGWEKGTWHGGTTGDGQRTALVVCPHCEKPASLTYFRIEPSGKVAPSFVCPHCSWHDYIQLEGWDAG